MFSSPPVIGDPISAVEGFPRIHQGDTVSIGLQVLCLNKTGSITIKSVTADNASGMQLTGWAMRPNPFWKPPKIPLGGLLSLRKAPLDQLGYTQRKTIDEKCAKNGEGYEIAIQAVKTTDGPAGASSFTVTYDTDGHTKHYTVNLAVFLCTENTSSSKACHTLKLPGVDPNW